MDRGLNRLLAREAARLTVLPDATRWPAATALALRHFGADCLHPSLCQHPALAPLFAARQALLPRPTLPEFPQHLFGPASEAVMSKLWSLVS